MLLELKEKKIFKPLLILKLNHWMYRKLEMKKKFFFYIIWRLF